MNVTKKVFLGVLAVGIAATAAYAATLMTDDFTYPDGSLTGQGGWTDHSGTTGQMQVFGGEVYVKGTDSEDVNKSFAAQTANATTYACFNLRVPPAFAGGPVVNQQYFAHMKDDGTRNYRSRVWVMPPNAAGDFTVGLSTQSNSSSPLVTWATDLSFDTNYRVVHSYNAATGDSRLWLDPVDEASTSIVSSLADAGGILISSYAWRQSSSDWTAITDKLSVGQAFDEVCNDPVQIDDTTWGSVKGIYR